MIYEELLFLGPFLAVFLGFILLVLPAMWKELFRTTGCLFALFATIIIGALLVALAFAVWVYLFVYFDVV
ncbi:MAG: hypothetical protein C0P64_007625 [Bacillota bacterium]